MHRIKAYAAFSKMRLASLVVFSAGVSFFMASDQIVWVDFMWLVLGGFLVTGSSNGFNQVIEKDFDKLMARTQNRPLPAGDMQVKEAMIVALIMGILGISILWFALNPLSGLLGTMALIMYVGVYTPMKRMSPWAVFVGAFPGAIPPMLGYVAVTGEFGLVPGLLFAIQFLWQFPHFWAIAWKLDDDYRKAGFSLLPSAGGKDASSAFQALVYSLFLIPLSLLPTYFGITGSIAAVVVLVTGVYYAFEAYRLYKNLDDKSATRLMFASFIYLPVVQLVLWLDKV
jgi:protoheme IX farnesyltransferase